MADTALFLADRLETEGAKSLEIFRALLPEHWELTVYTDGSAWTIRQLLAHFVTAEAGFLVLIDDILAGPKISISTSLTRAKYPRLAMSIRRS